MRLFLGLIISVFLSVTAFADDQHYGHPPQDEAIHEQFYSNWLRPDENLRNADGDRQHSCCNKNDCAPVDGVKYEDGSMWMLRHIDQRWIRIPPEKLETSYPDERQSPDVRAHMCSTGITVYCAVLGGGV
jgi:hypothetical protein